MAEHYGDFKVIPSSDSTDVFEVMDKDRNVIFAVDTTNNEVEVNGTLVPTSNPKTMFFNNFNINATWTNGTDGTCRLAASQTGEVFCIPLTGLKAGDIIRKFRIVGQIESGGNTATLDADLRKVTKGTADVTDASVGAITQVSKTADYSVDEEKDVTDETVATDYQYYVKVTGTTAAATDIAVCGVEVDVYRQ